ncbi:MAG: hypothetical protein AAB131_13775 [Actinomycetota bacterium]
MPSRIIREGIIDSDRIDKLDAPAEVFYRRLMSKVDDYGLFDARHNMLRTSLYPLRVDRVREADISRWIAACEKAGVIALYEHGGKPYGQMLETRWQARSEPKHPLPPWGKGAPPSTAVNGCAQVITPVPVFGDGVEVVEPPHPPAGGGDVDDEPVPNPYAGFDAFWEAWPKHRRKVAPTQCREKWRTQGCAEIADRVLASVAAHKLSDEWVKEGGKFIPAPLVWLNQSRWEAVFDAEPLSVTSDAAEKTQAYLAERFTLTPEEKAKADEAAKLVRQRFLRKEAA